MGKDRKEERMKGGMKIGRNEGSWEEINEDISDEGRRP